jgi:myo-inositol-1(or 4)-monophosphatase
MPASQHPGAAVDDAGWLDLCRSAARRLERILADRPTTAERAEEAGRGEGGDRSLVIDRDAETEVFSLLDDLHARGARFTVVSEERGEVDYGDPGLRVIIDPIDGSLNAKRDLPHHAISIAVAEGPTMADVVLGFVYDYGPGEEWVALRGRGAKLNGEPLDPDRPERRNREGRLEMVGIESADPRWVAASIDGLLASTHRLRALGSIAVSLCQVAAARLDGMVSLRRCRGFDAAAGQLIVREAGGRVAFPACDDPLGAPLDLQPRSPVVAARSDRALAELASVPSA